MSNLPMNEGDALLNGKMASEEARDGPLPDLIVHRPALTIEKRHKHCAFEVPEPLGFGQRFRKNLKKSCSCSRQKFLDYLYVRLPILGWLIGYKKEWLLGDIVAGITVAIMHIPQGMGFALLAHVPAICGIYMAFYQNLIYAILGTSRHNSMGSFAVITLMTGKVVKELATFPPADGLGAGNITEGIINNVTESLASPEAITYTPIQIATVVTFMVGIWHMVFGMLQLGSLAVFLSDMLVSGFTTAAAVHVLTSQMKDLLGIKIKGFNGPLKIVYTYIAIAKALPVANVASIIITIICLVILIINNELLKPIVAKVSKVPVPIELIAVVVGTASSYLADLETVYDVAIVGDIPTGLPPPAVPPLELLGRVAVDSFVIAIVSYVVNFSLAKIFAAKHGYPVDASQELYATGIGNLFSSFFACPPMATALARALIQDAVGGMTQLASLIVCVIIVLVLLFVGPLFESLPKAVLASIIVVALKGMFLQVKHPVDMWKVSKVESILWCVTFFSVVIIDIDLGLVIGIVFSLFVLLSKNQKPATFKLGRVPDTDLYLDTSSYPQAKEIPRMKLFRIVGAIHFANREVLRSLLVKGTGLDPKVIANSLKNKSDDILQKERMIMQAIENGTYSLDQFGNLVHFLVLDLSGLSYVDSSGGKFLEQIRAEYEKANISLCIAGLSEPVLEMMEKIGCLKDFPSNHLFHSLHDAVVILTSKKTKL